MHSFCDPFLCALADQVLGQREGVWTFDVEPGAKPYSGQVVVQVETADLGAFAGVVEFGRGQLFQALAAAVGECDVGIARARRPKATRKAEADERARAEADRLAECVEATKAAQAAEAEATRKKAAEAAVAEAETAAERAKALRDQAMAEADKAAIPALIEAARRQAEIATRAAERAASVARRRGIGG